MKPLRILRVLAAAIGFVLLAGSFVGSLDWCRRPSAPSPRLERNQSAQGSLLAGAAEVELQPPYPVVKAGYAPPRPEVTVAAHPLHARALVLEVSGLKVAIASLDVLLIPESLSSEVRRRIQDLGLAQIWLGATHTHSSMGGFDPRPISEMAGMGRYEEQAESSLVKAAVDALRAAAATLKPVQVEAGEARFPDLVTPRSEGAEPDGRISRIVMRQGPSVLAQLVVFAAHPTLLPRQMDALDPDFPGLFCDRERRSGHGITLFLQGAVGNVSVAFSAPDPWIRKQEFARQLSQANDRVALSPLAPASLEVRTVSIGLPNPDASRSAPRGLQNIGRNLLCRSAPARIEVSELKLGPLKLLFVPGEPTVGSEKRLLEVSGADRVVSLTNGYFGYLEAPELVLAHQGESKRQYFGPELLEVLASAARVAGHSTQLTQGK